MSTAIPQRTRQITLESMARRRNFWGWGWDDESPTVEQQEHIANLLTSRLGVGPLTITPAPSIDDVDLPPPRLTPPPALAHLCTTEPIERAGHSYGKSFRDIVRAFRREYGNPPDIVALPRSEADLVAVLDWCTDARAAAIPYGGGSSVVGGVEPPSSGSLAGSVSIDLRYLDRVLEIDKTSRAARIQAGIYGPALENQLRPEGLTLRHYPQSFEFSTLGGWIATRSGGHFATLQTHIDDFVEGLRVVTPTGIAETRRLPGSGAGPSPDRLFVGSEGILGVITEAWVRLQVRPRFRASCSIPFAAFSAGAEAARAIGQSGLYPSNCRLLDAGEAETAGAGSGEHAVLLLAFESADHRPDAWMARALECAADHGGQLPEEGAPTRTDERSGREGAAGAWRKAFLGAPYLRDALVAMGMISETFETAITWDRFATFHAGVMSATIDAVRRICGSGRVTCRFTHVYPDGVAPYYTVLAPAAPGSQLEQWDEIKAAAADTLIAQGGTITHHHAVGRDHRPWYDRQRPDVFAHALVAAKHALDPHGILNPGVLVDPAP
jgi:alkyldihydroxyacetonephosphate synthase